MRRITLKGAKALTIGDIVCLNYVYNTDGTCARYRVSGAVHTWKLDRNRVKVPLKRGMYEFGYLTENNLKQFHERGTCPKCRE